jgi:hypothetical protein
VTWAVDHLLLTTIVTPIAVVALALLAFVVSLRIWPARRVLAPVVAVTVAIATAIVSGVALGQVWTAKRDSVQRQWAARRQHLQRLQILLRTESVSLDGIARGLTAGRPLTLGVNDARRAIWQDEVLTSDVERHFPEYFRQREALIQSVLNHESELAQVRQTVSASLPLTAGTEPFRPYLLQALVNKCAGAGSDPFFTQGGDGDEADRLGKPPSGADRSEHDPAKREALRVYAQYRCTPELATATQGLSDRAEDLADAASLLSESARRSAEETILQGWCTYAPAP